MKGSRYEGKSYKGQIWLQYPLVNELKTSYSDNFKHIVTAWPQENYILSTDEMKISRLGQYIEDGAPEMFTWQMIKGTWSGLKDPQSIMLSETTARILFGDDDPLEKLVRINNELDVKVTGVYADFPLNTEFHNVQFFAPWSLLVSKNTWITSQGWDNHFLFAYVEIDPNTNFEKVSANIREAELKIIKGIESLKEQAKYGPQILLHPMSDWHLYSNFKDGVADRGPVQQVKLVGIIGAFVLILACINFMNLSTARSERRAKEVGIRKTIGSLRGQIVSQFFSESFLVVALSFVFALSMTAISLPLFNEIAVKRLTILWTNPWFWLVSFGFIFLTGILAGSYPALYLSSFQPVKVLKGTFRAGRFGAIPRKVLVVAQFAVSVTLIISTIIVYNQIVFAKNRPVGYTREGLLMIEKKSKDFYGKYNVLRNELKNSGVVEEMSESARAVTELNSNNAGFDWKDMAPAFEANLATLSVSPHYGKTVGWQFVNGRDFSDELVSDSSGFILNEAAVKHMGLSDPVGEIIHWKNKWWNVEKDFKVLGVVKDMVMESPFMPAKPTVFFLQGWQGWINVKINLGVSMGEALPEIERVIKKVIPGAPFEYKFADEEYALKFATEERIGKLSSVFAILAILISSLGLFGLASFVAEQRTKEIGIRKVLGASVTNLWRMLSKDFVVLVIISCVIAIPVSFYFMNNWLQGYEYRTEISWWIFLITSIGALTLTLFTVSFQSIKAAMMNPVNSLKSE
jgi:putative ABC transport system permease protein